MKIPTKAQALAAIERAEKATLMVTRTGHLDYEDDRKFISAARTDVPTLAQAYMEAMGLLEKVLSPCQHCKSAGQISVPSSEPKYRFETIDCPRCIGLLRSVIAAYHAQEIGEQETAR